MTPSMAAYAALTLTLALSVVLYLAIVWHVANRASAVGARGWMLAAPVHAWRRGSRALPLAFVASVVSYGGLALAFHTAGSW
jgi:hypothetical protein